MADELALDGMHERLQAAANAVNDARVEYELALQTRDELVVQAVDEGMAQRNVAAAIGVGQPHVVRILAGSERDAVLPRA